MLAHELTHTIQQDASSRIFRAVGMITEKTHLRIPNSEGNAPRKGPKLFNMLKGELEPGKSIELLDKKSPSDEPVWQLAKNPETNQVGFVRLSKVLATGVAPPTIEEAKKNLKLEKGKIDFKAIADELINIASNSGDALGKVEESRKNIVEAYVEDLWVKDQGKVKQLANISDASKTPDEIKIQAQTEWAKNNPITVNITRGIMFGGLGVGAAGDVLSGFTSLFEIAQGLGKIDKKGWTAVEGSLMSLKGGGVLAGSVAGLGQKGFSALGAVIGAEDTPAGKTVSSVSEGFGALGGILKVLKAPIEIVLLFIKGIRNLYEKSKKQVKTKASEVFDWFVDLAKAAWGGVSGAFDTVKSVYNGIKTWWAAMQGVGKTLIGPIFGIVGSVIQIVTAAIDGVKLAKNIITSFIENSENNKLIKKIEDEKYKSTEQELPLGLLQSPQKLKRSKSGKPDVVHLREMLKQYESKPKDKKTPATEKDYKTAQTYLVDRDLVDILKKRLMRAKTKIGDWIFDGLSILTSVTGALATILFEVLSIATSPTGAGLAVFQAAKIISGAVFGAIGVILSLVKGAYTIGRPVVRWMKQASREVGAWFGKKGLKTKSWKHEARVKDTLAVMDIIANLKDYKPNKKSRKVYERVQLRLTATGVDLEELYQKKGKPEEQAKLIYQALAKRESS